MKWPQLAAWQWATMLALAIAAVVLLTNPPAEHGKPAGSSSDPSASDEEPPCPAGTLPDEDVCVPAPRK